MTQNGHFEAARIPIFGLLDKGHRAALSARRIIGTSGSQDPDVNLVLPPVTAPLPVSRAEPAGVSPSNQNGRST